MSTQAQVDFNFISSLVNKHGKKEATAFQLAKAEKAISALLKKDAVEGYRVKSSLAFYKGDYENALYYLSNIKKLSTVANFDLLYLESNIYLAKGEWNEAKKLFVEMLELMKNEQSERQLHFQRIILLTAINFLDIDFIDVHCSNFINKTDKTTLLNIKTSIDTLGIELSSYREVVSIIYMSVLQNYNTDLVFTHEFEDNCLSIVCFTDLLPIETSNLNDMLINNLMSLDMSLEQSMKLNATFVTGFKVDEKVA